MTCTKEMIEEAVKYNNRQKLSPSEWYFVLSKLMYTSGQLTPQQIAERVYLWQGNYKPLTPDGKLGPHTLESMALRFPQSVKKYFKALKKRCPWFTYVVDISDYQKDVDWVSLYYHGVNGVIIKASEGADWKSETIYNHIAGADSVGLPYGFYHLARPYNTSYPDSGNIAPPESNYHNFVNMIKGYSPKLGVWLDMEHKQTKLAVDAGCNVNNWVRDWMELFHVQGVQPGIYLSHRVAKLMNGQPRHLDFDKYQTWWASYGHKPFKPDTAGNLNWHMRQFTDECEVYPGFECDMNVFNPVMV